LSTADLAALFLLAGELDLNLLRSDPRRTASAFIASQKPSLGQQSETFQQQKLPTAALPTAALPTVFFFRCEVIRLTVFLSQMYIEPE
jgi:hypothetical protein